MSEKLKHGTKPYKNKLSQEDIKLANSIVPIFDPAIKSAENDRFFGVRPKPKTVAEAQKILNNSIVNNFVRWRMDGSPGKFVDFMRKRWAPLTSEGATNDPDNLNINWAPNVRTYLKKDPKQYQELKKMNLVKSPLSQFGGINV